MRLFFKQSKGSTGAVDCNFGPKQGVGIVKNVKQAAEQESKQIWQLVLNGFNDRGAGWNTVRQQVLCFAEFDINVLTNIHHCLKPIGQVDFGKKIPELSGSALFAKIKRNFRISNTPEFRKLLSVTP